MIVSNNRLIKQNIVWQLSDLIFFYNKLLFFLKHCVVSKCQIVCIQEARYRYQNSTIDNEILLSSIYKVELQLSIADFP